MWLQQIGLENEQKTILSIVQWEVNLSVSRPDSVDALIPHSLTLLDPLIVFLVPTGGWEAGAGRRVWLPHREGEAGDPELHSHPESHPPLHLWGPGLERLLLVDGAGCRSGWGEWALGRKTYVQKTSSVHLSYTRVYDNWYMGICSLLTPE